MEAVSFQFSLSTKAIAERDNDKLYTQGSPAHMQNEGMANWKQ